ncbi:MAG: uroporphyrinogen decarboxylase family protein [Oliverpabstia sp.]
MTKTEIVKETLKCKNRGIVPYSIYLSIQGYDVYGEQLIQEYASEKIKKDYKEGRLTKKEAASLAIGNYIMYIDPPWWDWYNLPPCFAEEDTPDILPDTIGMGSYEEFFSKVKYLKENYDAYILVTVWGSHWEKAYFSRGIENFLCDLAADPEWSKELLDMIIRKNMVMLENILCCENIDGVLLGSDWGAQKDMLMSPECFRTLIKDGEKKEYDLIKKYGKNVFVHSCGNILRIMDDLAEIGVECLNPIQPECMDIEFLKKEYGDRMAFYGGISTQRTLPYGTPDDVRQETIEITEMMSKNGGYIIAPSQEIQEDVPYENLCALIEAAKECSEAE